jgi:transglutaminase-like putative cysteine protease
MNAAPNAPVALQGLRLAERVAARDLEAPLRLAAFAALASYVSAAWLGLIAESPAGRAALAVLVLVTGAAVLAWLGAGRVTSRVKWIVAPFVSLLAIVAGAIAIGLPARLVAPWNWDELAANLSGGWVALLGVDYPYDGTLEWTRLLILLGLPVIVGVAGALAFWPARRGVPLLRALALIVLVGAYGAAATINPPDAPLLDGVVLLLLIWAWLWLPGRGGREALVGGGLILAAGLLAMPITTSIGDRGPLVDWRSWGAGAPNLRHTESFVWDQSYGPLTWARVGRTMFEVSSDGPYYWRTAVLDEFDGTSWVQSDAPGNGALQLPRRPLTRSKSPRLDPDWIHRFTVTMRGLSSDLVVGAGTPLQVPELGGVTVMERGLVLPSDQPLSDGESYEMRSYIPNPSPAQLRNASVRYPAALSRDTEVTLPGGRSIDMPFWGAPPDRAADRVLAKSAYGGVYQLARSVTAGASSPYEAVSAVETYLSTHYRYSEFAPIDRLALRDFLLSGHAGYCQHFSGAMALMLRMVGIPARVAAGFSPGRPNSDGAYVVTDFDAHAWVETYFTGIGWVTFDPTPPAAPARSRVSGLGSSIAADAGGSSGSTSTETNSGPHGRSVDEPVASSTPSQSAPLPPLAIVAAGLATFAAVGFVSSRRPRRARRPLRDEELTEAQLREVASALARVRSWTTRGVTLLSLERRLATDVGPGAATYVARIRAARYAPGDNPPPGTSLRAALRRELVSGTGLRGRLRGLLAIPPGRLRRAISSKRTS